MKGSKHNPNNHRGFDGEPVMDIIFIVIMLLASCAMIWLFLNLRDIHQAPQ